MPLQANQRDEVYSVYILECSDGSYYTGLAKDVAARLARHNAGKGARYTRGRGPCKVLATLDHLTIGLALRIERSIKQAPRSCKLAKLAEFLSMLNSM